jgi:hypothetical protein
MKRARCAYLTRVRNEASLASNPPLETAALLRGRGSFFLYRTAAAIAKTVGPEVAHQDSVTSWLSSKQQPPDIGLDYVSAPASTDPQPAATNRNWTLSMVMSASRSE